MKLRSVRNANVMEGSRSMAIFSEESKIEINMRDGDPNGIRVASMAMSPIRAFAFRKSQYRQVRKDYPWIDDRTGVYMLIGPERNNNHKLTAYIGESENVGERLYGHIPGNRYQNRNWVDTVLLASNDDMLTDAHGRYVESQLIRSVPKSSRWHLMNTKVPSKNAGNLRASDRSIMDQFLLQAKTLVGCLGWDLFRNFYDLTQQNVSEDQEGRVIQSPDTPKFIAQGKGHCAEMLIDTSGNFVVLKGSRARIIETDSFQEAYRKIRKSFLKDGTFKERDGAYVLTKNCSFTSVSTAARIVKGMSATGNSAWKVKGEKTTYAQWEASQGE